MAPTPQQLLLIAQAKRRRAENGAGFGATNPMVAQGQAAQEIWRDAGSKPANPNPENPIITAQRSSQTQAMGDWAQQREAERQAEAARAKARRESAAAFGGGMDLMPTEDEAGNVRPGSPADTDIGKGIITLLPRAERAAVGAGEAIANAPGDFMRSAAVPYAMAFDPSVQGAMAGWEFGVNGAGNAPERFAEAYNKGGYGEAQRKLDAAPRFDFSRAKVPIPQELESITGSLAEGFMQYAAARGLLGKMAPGGGLGLQLAKDTGALGVGFSGDSGRTADMIDLNNVPEGALRDFVRTLKTQPGDSPFMGRVKNMTEDATINLLLMGLGRFGGKLVEAASSRPQTPTNAGGTAARLASQAPAATPQSVPVSEAPIPQAAPRAAQARPSGAGQGAGQGAGSVPPVLNAAPVVGKPSRIPRDTQRILSSLLKAASVPGNDIDRLSTALFEAYETFKASGSEFAPRVSLGRFIDKNLAEVAANAGINLPDVTIRDVQQGLRGRGRTAHGDGDPGDRSRAIMSGTIGDLRTTQKDFARGQIEAPDAFNVTAIADQKKALERNAEAIGKEAYNPTLQFAKNVWDGVEAAKPGEKEALQKLQQYLLREPYLNAIPADLKLRLALDEIPLETRIKQDPAGTAHWLQSKLGQAAADSTDGGMRGALGDARERLLVELDKAIPAYKNIRADYGDEFRTLKMLDSGKTFFADTLRPADTADLADLYKAGTARQKTAMRMSVRDELFTVFDGTPEDVALRLEKLTSEGRLRGLEEIFGAPGKKVADTLRFIRDESLWLRGDSARGLQGVDALSGSNTVPSALARANDAKAVRTGFQGAISNLADRSRIWAAMLTDAALAFGSGGAYHYPMLTAGAIGSKAARGLGNPSRKVMANATEGLFGLPKQTNALANPPSTPPKANRGPRAPKPELPTTMRELQEAYQSATTRAERARIQKQMARVGTNALASPPSSPPVKAGFFGGSKPPLDMSEAARMQRAREQGFDTKRVAYRGLNRSYDEGGGGRRYQMFTSSESDAAEYGSNIVAAYLRKGNNLQLDGGGRNFNSVLVSQLPDDVRAKLHPSIQGVARIDDIADAAQKAGYDSVTVENVFDNSWGEIPPKPRARTQKDIDELNAIFDELGVEALPAEATPRVKTLEKNYDPVTIDVVFDTKNIRSTDAAFDPSQSGSSKLLSGLGASPEGIGAAGGATYGYLVNPTDANGDGVIDDQDRGLNAMGGLVSGGILAHGGRRAVGAVGNALKGGVASRALEPLELSKANRVYAPGKPDDLGFITSAEYVLANPPARFRDAKALTADQWRKLMREGGASGESFKWQIEPALKRLADEGVTGDIPKARFEEALARTRGTLDRVGIRQLGDIGFESQRMRETRIADDIGIAIGQNRTREVERLRAKQQEMQQSYEAKYDEYVAPGKSSNYQQHVLTLPESQGQGYKSHNWNTKNPVGHVRTTNRTSANGEKVLHVEELQSDLHQEAAKYGYRGESAPPDAKQLRAASQLQKAAESKYQAWADANPTGDLPYVGFSENLVNQIADPVGRELYREAIRAKNTYHSLINAQKLPPKAPLENWEEPFIRYALKQGADQGVDVVTFPKWDTLHDALKNEGTQKFYDGRLPQHLASVAKSLGLKVEQIELPMAVGFAGSFKAGQRGNKFAVANDKLGEWYFSAGEFDTLHEAQQAAARLNKKTQAVPAIRLTPEAKQRLSEGIIMDAKDPGRRAPAKRPPPAQAGFGGSSGQGGKGPPGNALKVGRGVVEQVERAAKAVSPEVKNRLAANARLPYGQRKTAMEAAGDDPSLYRMAAPYQGAGRKKPTALDLGIEQGVKRAATLPKDVSLNPLLNAVEVTRKASSAAQRAETAAYKAGKIKEPGHPLVQTRIHAERAARDAKQKLLDASLEAIGREEAINQVNRRVSEIADELMKGPQAGPVARLPKPAPWHKNGRRGDLPKPKSRREANEMARLLFDEEYADILSKALDGTLPLKARTPAHYVLSLAAAGAGTAGIAAMAYDLKKRGEESMRKNGLLPAIEPPKDPRRQFNWEERSKDREVVRSIQIALNNIDPTYELAEDGLYYTNSRRNPSRTEQAVRFWQHENGFEATGEVTDEQMRMLYQMGEEARRNRNAARASGRPANALAPAQLQ